VALGAVAPTVLLVPEAAKAIVGTKLEPAALDALAAVCSAACRRSTTSAVPSNSGGRLRACLPGAPQGLPTSGRSKVMAGIAVSTTINGDSVDFLCQAEETLLDVLRDRLGLTGAKEGCGTGDCGACSVIVDGRLVCACLVLGAEARGVGSRPSRAWRPPDKLHPLQEKFLEHAALQCGICTPGFLMAAKYLSPRTLIRRRRKSVSGWPATSAVARATTR